MNDYALLSTKRDRFMIVSDDHETLKFLQLLIMDYELLYLVSLSGISNYRSGLLNDGRYFKTTLANVGSKIEIDMYISDPSYRVIPSKQIPTEEDVELREKLSFLTGFIQKITVISDQLLEKNQRQFRSHKEGLEVFKKFLRMTLPNDQAIQNFIDREISNKEITDSVKERLLGEIFSRLKEMDYDLPLARFKETFSEMLDTIPMVSGHFRDAVPEIKKVLA